MDAITEQTFADNIVRLVNPPKVLGDQPGKFTDPFQFEIEFECKRKLANDLEWKIVYVGSAEDDSKDQVLESLMVGPVEVGNSKFIFQANSPNASQIPAKDLLGVTAVLVCGCYNGKEFVRTGFYVNNEYDDEQLRENPPATPVIDKIARNILDKPRTTEWEIEW